MKNILKSALALGSGLVALLLVGCGGDSGGGTSTGPASGASFAGASVSFNPTITFTSGTQFSWENENGDVNTLVITDPGEPVTGTFTYVPSADFKTGTLTFTFDDPLIPAKQLNLSNFTGSATGITSFTISIDSVSYNGRVLGSGSALLPQITITAPGGGGGTGGGGNIANGTTYNGTVGSVTPGIENGPDAGSLTPPALATGSATLRISSDRSQVQLNGGAVASLQLGIQVPGLGGTGTYVLSSSGNLTTTSTQTLTVYFSNGNPSSAQYDSLVTSGSGTNTKSIQQAITIP